MIPSDINREFERLLCAYTGAPYAVAVDNCCNALFLCLRYWRRFHFGIQHQPPSIGLPRHTYIGVPYAVRQANLKPVTSWPELTGERTDGMLSGEYKLISTNIWDSALRFTSGMYRPGQMQCLSFTGPFKHLKLGKGGAILTDNKKAHDWLQRAAFSGRNACSYHVDTFDMPEGYNMYMPHIIAAHGVHMMQGFPEHNEDLCLPYPDWSIHSAFQK